MSDSDMSTHENVKVISHIIITTDQSNVNGGGYVAEHFRLSNFDFPQFLHLGLELGLVLVLG